MVARSCAPLEPSPLFMSIEEHGLHVYLVLGIILDISLSTYNDETHLSTSRFLLKMDGRDGSHVLPIFC